MADDAEDYIREMEAAAHASSHEAGGSDEILVEDMSSHGSTHESGGGDEIDCSGLPGVGNSYVDRGDFAASDFNHAGLIDDADWHDLDLSGILPAGAVAVHIRMSITGDSTNRRLRLRKKGHTGVNNWRGNETVVVDVNHESEHIITCDSDLFIQYYMNTLTACSIFILGWFA